MSSLFEKGFPLISCVSLANSNVANLQRTIHCFHAQDYTSRELIVIVQRQHEDVVHYLKSIAHNSSIRWRVVDDNTTVGFKRNLATELAEGEFICQWEVDDWHHARRLSVQVESLLANNHPAALLTNWLMYDLTNKLAYFSSVRLWENSLLVRRKLILDFPYSDHIDSEKLLVATLLRKSKVVPVVSPNIYVYAFTVQNEEDQAHFHELTRCSKRLSDNNANLIANILNSSISPTEGSILLNASDFIDDIDYFPIFKNTNLEFVNAKFISI